MALVKTSGATFGCPSQCSSVSLIGNYMGERLGCDKLLNIFSWCQAFFNGAYILSSVYRNVRVELNNAPFYKERVEEEGAWSWWRLRWISGSQDHPPSALLVSPISQSFQAGLTQFQAAARKRESMRLKLQMGAAPGILEKDLADKIRVEESVCKVLLICLQAEPSSCHGFRELQGFSVLVRMRRNASKLPKTFCLASWGWTCSSLSWTS